MKFSSPFAPLQRLLLCVLASAGLAHAPATLAAEWDGYSFSVLGGAPLQGSRVNAEVRAPIATSYFAASTDAGQVAAEGSDRFSGADWLGSVKVGYSWQSGHVVTGIDISTDTGFEQSFTHSAVWLSATTERFSITQRIKADPVLAIRPRVGWAWDNTMVYGTAGLAAVRVSLDTTFSDNLIFDGVGGHLAPTPAQRPRSAPSSASVPTTP